MRCRSVLTVAANVAGFVVEVPNFIAAKLIMCKPSYAEGAQYGAIHLAGTKQKAL